MVVETKKYSIKINKPFNCFTAKYRVKRFPDLPKLNDKKNDNFDVNVQKKKKLSEYVKYLIMKAQIKIHYNNLKIYVLADFLYGSCIA